MALGRDRLANSTRPGDGVRDGDAGTDGVCGGADGVRSTHTGAASDCATGLVVDRTMPQGYLPSVLGHEFGHAVVMANECAAPSPHAADTYRERLSLLTPERMYESALPPAVLRRLARRDAAHR